MTTPRIQLRALEVCAELGHPIEPLSPFERALCIAVEERLTALERRLMPEGEHPDAMAGDTNVLGLVPLPAYLEQPPSQKVCRVCGVPTGAVDVCPEHITATVSGGGGGGSTMTAADVREQSRHAPGCKLNPNHRGNCRT